MPRCYTKSGNIEKYEPNLFSLYCVGFSGQQYNSTYFTYNVTPDSNGNYELPVISGYELVDTYKSGSTYWQLSIYYGESDNRVTVHKWLSKVNTPIIPSDPDHEIAIGYPGHAGYVDLIFYDENDNIITTIKISGGGSTSPGIFSKKYKFNLSSNYYSMSFLKGESNSQQITRISIWIGPYSYERLYYKTLDECPNPTKVLYREDKYYHTDVPNNYPFSLIYGIYMYT